MYKIIERVRANRTGKQALSEIRDEVISTTTSIEGDVKDVIQIQPSIIGRGICRDEPLTDSGKKLQLVKMLCLTVLPILGLWAYTVYTLADIIEAKNENESTRSALEFSVELGKLVHHLQKERDMSVLYLSALGPQTRTFLLSEYIETDQAISKLSRWPEKLDTLEREKFETRENLQQYLSRRRQVLSPTRYSLQDEIDFYTGIIEVVIIWMYNSINESKFALVWKTLVAYQKLTSAKEAVGVERALGTMYFANGGFENHGYFEMYNNRVHNFRAYYKSARRYSMRVVDLYTVGVASAGNNVTDIIDNYRSEIQQHVQGVNVSQPNLSKARWWFDNMTLYLDTLLDIQQDLGNEILSILDEVLDQATRDLVVSAIFLVVVILMCPLIIFVTENLTSVIQKYALTLVDKTKELTLEKKVTDSLLYQMVPKQVADKLKRSVHIDAEYFKSVTIFFSDIVGFATISTTCTPMDIVQLLNEIYVTIDDLLDDYDVYKVETINDCYMVASGLPNRNKDKHAGEIATFALDLLGMMKHKQFIILGDRCIELRIGINSGPCMAGIVGSILPRYCLFGDTVNTASRMKSISMANRISISHTTYTALNKLKGFIVRKRGTVNVKGKGEMVTYWLIGKKSNGNGASSFHLSDGGEEEEGRIPPEELPGEITHYNESQMKAAFSLCLPGRSISTATQSNSHSHSEISHTPSVATTANRSSIVACGNSSSKSIPAAHAVAHATAHATAATQQPPAAAATQPTPTTAPTTPTSTQPTAATVQPPTSTAQPTPTAQQTAAQQDKILDKADKVARVLPNTYQSTDDDDQSKKEDK